MVLVTAGAVAGLAAAVWLGRFVAPLLYGLQARDPATLAGAAVTLIAVAGTAAMLPAWRASRVDPALVLRQN
jgi:ABC-type antimicrobial peptide transport system permease subunit